MRDDQYARLQALEEKLTEAFLAEADPVNWTGDGILPKNLTQAERGDRYWCKKNAVATISLTMRIGSLIGMVLRRTPDVPPGTNEEPDNGEGLLDAEVSQAEGEARKLLAQISRRTLAKSKT